MTLNVTQYTAILLLQATTESTYTRGSFLYLCVNSQAYRLIALPSAFVNTIAVCTLRLLSAVHACTCIAAAAVGAAAAAGGAAGAASGAAAAAAAAMPGNSEGESLAC
jgi:hypothetical protein